MTTPSRVVEAAQELAAELRALEALGEPVRAHVDLRERKTGGEALGVDPQGRAAGGRDRRARPRVRRGHRHAPRRPGAGARAGEARRVRGHGAGALEATQQQYFDEAKARLEARTTTDVADVDAFREFFSGDELDSGGFVRAPWSEDPATEKVMGELGVSVRCIPFDQDLPDGAKCVISGAPARVEAIFAKAY